MPPCALTIAGSDPSGGAGAQADLKTFSAFGVYGTSVLTAVTAQNTTAFLGVWKVAPEAIALQYEAVVTDIAPDAAKTGMLVDRATIETVASCLERWPIENLVVDPVMVSTSGEKLLEPEAIELFKTAILPKAALLTPNLPEAEALSAVPIRNDADTHIAAEKLVEMGARAVLIKGGHGSDPASSDDLFFDGSNFRLFTAPRVGKGPMHGTGCTLSAAIAALLARGESLAEAVDGAKRYVTRAIESAPELGKGAKPLNHLMPDSPDR